MKMRTVAALVAAVILGYPASSWFLGRQVHSTLDTQYEKLRNYPLIQVKERKVDSGVFESLEVVTFEVMPGIADAVNKSIQKRAEQQMEAESVGREGEAQDQEQGVVTAPATMPEPMAPLRFTVRTVFKHGPLPGLTGVGAAKAHSELVLDAPRHPMITTLYGDKVPLTVDTDFGFTGGGHQVVLSPAVDSTLENKNKISWGELRIEIDFSRGMADYTMTGGLPFFKLQSSDNTGTVSATALLMEAKQKRLFEDDDFTYTGPARITLETLNVANPAGVAFSVEKLAITSDSSSQGDFLDVKAGYSLQKLTVGPEVIGPSQIDIGMRHFHARALSDINKEYMKMFNNPSLFSEGAAPDPVIFKAMANPARTILESSPEIAIDKLEVALPQGKMTGQVVVRMPNAKIGDLSVAAENPLVLMGLVSAVEVDGKVAIPEALLLAAAKDRAEMVPAMVSEGYIVQENGVISTSFKYATGQLTVNGKPVNLGQMGGRD